MGEMRGPCHQASPMRTGVKKGVNLNCVMEGKNEKREFRMEELPLQSLQGVEDHGVMRLHKDPGPKVRG